MTQLFNQHRHLSKRRSLRKNRTITERMLWSRIKEKKLGIKFRQQYGIGKFVVDFCSPRQKLIIEIEGGLHDKREEKEYDEERREILEDTGFKVLIFTNEEIEKDIGRVLDKIENNINS